MSRSSKHSSWISGLILLLVVAAAVKLLWVAVELFVLPSTGTDPRQSETGKSLYRPYRLASNEALRRPSKPRPKAAPGTRIRSLKLLGLYQDDQRSIAVIAKGAKSFLVTPGERVLGYRLLSVEPEAALLEKGGKRYRLELYQSSAKKQSDRSDTGNVRVPVTPAASPEGNASAPETTEPPEGPITISRKTLNKYTTDLDTIRKQIGLTPYKTDGSLHGFKVRFIRKGSDFEKLGLKRGDVITGINGEQIVDLSVPMELMHNLQTLEGLTLQVKRGEKELELEYEIR